MVRVLLVDDEIFTIRMLQNIISWAELGMQVIGYAQSGTEAYEKTVKEKPDIIISDICMPGMDGLEFIKAVRNFDDSIKTILMSAYADFSYVKEGMKLGCSDYILKPIDEAELEQVLQKVIQEIRGKKEQDKALQRSEERLDQMNLYQYMRTGYRKNHVLKSKRFSGMQKYCVFMIQLSNATIEEYDNSSNIQMDHEKYITSILEKLMLSFQREFRILDYDEGCWIVILDMTEGLRREDIAVDIDACMVKETGLRVKISFSSTGSSIDELPALYDEVCNLSRYSFYMGDTNILGYGYNCNKEELDKVRNIDIIRDLEQAIKNGNKENALSILNEAIDSSLKGNPDVLGSIYDLCYQTATLVRKYLPEDEKEQNELLTLTYENISEIQSLKALRCRMADILEKLPDAGDPTQTAAYSKPVKESIKLIEKNYDRNLSLEEICREVAVSKNYFSYLFKRETGMNLWNYLTIIRLQHAKQLLEETDLKSYEIAFKVGYDNPSYFSKIFRKYENMTPNEYRESKGIT